MIVSTIYCGCFVFMRANPHFIVFVMFTTAIVMNMQHIIQIVILDLSILTNPFFCPSPVVSSTSGTSRRHKKAGSGKNQIRPGEYTSACAKPCASRAQGSICMTERTVRRDVSYQMSAESRMMLLTASSGVMEPSQISREMLSQTI